MSTVLLIRSRIKSEHTADVEAALGRMFAAIEREQPGGIRYSSNRLPDGHTYIALLELETPEQNPLPAIPEFQQFQSGLQQWTEEPPAAEPLTVIQSYRSF